LSQPPAALPAALRRACSIPTKDNPTMKRKTEITIQTRRVLVVRRRERARLWCDRCGGQVEMLAAREAVATTGLTERAVFRLAEAGLLHATETTDGRLFVCLDSLREETRASAEGSSRT
jgi:hypothetical protein